jgi:hypothetical protein
MTRRVRAGLAGVGRMGRIHAAGLATRCPAAERTGDGGRFTVEQESR